MQRERGTQPLSFGSDSWNVRNRYVQLVLLVAKYKTDQRAVEAKAWAAACPVKESGPCPVGDGSLGTVWEIRLKDSSLQAGGPARRAWPLGLCLLLEFPLAI